MAIVVSGINPETNRDALLMAEKHENVKCTIGIYPKEAFEGERKQLGYKDFDINEEITWMDAQIKGDKKRKRKLIFGVGEIGLDFVDIKRDNEKDKQKVEKDKELFVEQIRLAKKYNLPVVVHSRKAEEEVLDIIEKEKTNKVILHAFGGAKRLIKRGIELGYFFSIPPVVTRASHFQMIAKEVPIKQLFTETDAPYLGNELGKRNEPKNVSFAVEKIAEIKGVEGKEVEKIIYENYLSLSGD